MSPQSYYPFMAPGDQLYTIDYEMQGEKMQFVFCARNVEDTRARFAAMKHSGVLRPDTIEAVYPCAESPHSSSSVS